MSERETEIEREAEVLYGCLGLMELQRSRQQSGNRIVVDDVATADIQLTDRPPATHTHIHTPTHTLTARHCETY